MDELNPDLKKIILKLHSLRPNSRQFLFFSAIYPKSTLNVRTEVVKFKELNKDCNEIDFIIFSPGGLADDAYRIIRTLRKNFDTVNVIVPFWAKSAATLLALGANKIIMDEFGEFGPLDAQLGKQREDGPQFDSESALNDEHSVSIIENHYKMMYEEMYIRLFEHRKINISKNELSEQLLKNLSNFFNPLMSQIDPYKLGDKQRKLDIGSQYATRILSQFGAAHDPATARVLVNYLIHECPDHGYVIDLDILSQFVTNVSSSSELGAEYESALRELSFYLFEADEVDHIGFILPDANMKIAEQPSSELVKIENATAKKTAKKQKNGAVIEPNNSIPVEEIIEN